MRHPLIVRCDGECRVEVEQADGAVTLHFPGEMREPMRFSRSQLTMPTEAPCAPVAASCDCGGALVDGPREPSGNSGQLNPERTAGYVEGVAVPPERTTCPECERLRAEIRDLHASLAIRPDCAETAEWMARATNAEGTVVGLRVRNAQLAAGLNLPEYAEVPMGWGLGFVDWCKMMLSDGWDGER